MTDLFGEEKKLPRIYVLMVRTSLGISLHAQDDSVLEFLISAAMQVLSEAGNIEIVAKGQR